jgi:hypothetical protein
MRDAKRREHGHQIAVRVRWAEMEQVDAIGAVREYTCRSSRVATSQRSQVAFLATCDTRSNASRSWGTDRLNRDGYNESRMTESGAGVSTIAVAIGLNVLLLAMIAYGYAQSEDLRWAWVLVGVPIVVVTITYLRHWFRQ